MGVPAFETTALTKRFPKQPGWRSLLRSDGERTALDDVTITVERGEIFGLLGPNGAGKTTLVKILSTLVTPTTGGARVAGFDVVAQESEVRRRIGLAYGDERSFYWRLSLRENLRFYGRLYGLSSSVGRKRSDELIELVGLTEAADLRMHYFSSGMKQRAAIARGLLSDPELLLLDEPTKAVDPVAAYDIRRMIQERVVGAGRTVLLTTNIMAEAEALCGRLALLNRGRVELAGPVHELRAQFQPDDIYDIRVTGQASLPLAEMRAIYGVLSLDVRREGAGENTLTVSVQRESPTIPHVVRSLVGASISVWSCTRRELSLEEMFLMKFGEGTVDLPAQSAKPTPALAREAS